MIQLGDIGVKLPVCCMCGDSGLPDELYSCRLCLFRSQHRYCSNQYPIADGAYEVCNWCLIPAKEGSSDSTKKAAGNNSLDSNPSHYKTPESGQDDDGRSKRLRKSTVLGLDLRNGADRNGNGKGRVKKADEARRTNTRKRIITRGALEEKLRMMKSDKAANRRDIIVRRPVFRNKVRRYKLLHEVSC
ncbi:hypothetical protein MLD38_001689 [Melastoma candidum]|uniref:Uncharacterized protein n=1 Tax=Melastoma candidum TaxID=119954 RepID=A0ACB9SI02_9MYRT|nr:hypothetical protein MLD38_001689 [Melastoma candidum]